MSRDLSVRGQGEIIRIAPTVPNSKDKHDISDVAIDDAVRRARDGSACPTVLNVVSKRTDLRIVFQSLGR